ncbi:SRPBCC family protein [Streptomyces sp. NPDC002004]
MRTILHVVVTKASRSALYEALTTQEGLAGWWTTGVSAMPVIGSVISFRFTGDFHPEMKIMKLDPDTEIDWICVGGHDPWDDARFVFGLSDLPDGSTRLRFRQEYAQEPSDDAFGTDNFAWAHALVSLRRYAETGIGRPFRPEG